MNEPSLRRVGDEGGQRQLPSVPDAISIDLSDAPGLPRTAQRRLWSTSLLTAFAAHALILFGLGWVPGLKQAGAGGVELEAIDIDIVSSKVLESRSSTARTTTAALANVDHSAQGTTAAAASTGSIDQRPSQAETEAVSAGPKPDLVIPDIKQEEPPPEPAELELAVADRQPQTPDALEPETEQEPRDDPNPQSSEPSQASEASEASDEGGAAARGLAAIVEPPARQAAAASPGVANEYAKSVIETLARRKPRATAGVRGTVRIGFSVAHTGEVREARVLSSSGLKVLDEAALSAVRNAKFPAPPPALANGPLSYEVPYIFR